MREKINLINADVAVVGGGPAGVGAALAAARNGARTILIEKNSVLGGQMTSGMVSGFHGLRIHKGFRDRESEGPYIETNYETEQVVKGIPQEMVDRLVNAKAASIYRRDPGSSPMRVEFDPEPLKWILFEMMEEAGVELLLNSFAFDCRMVGDKIDTIKVANKSGEQLVKASMYVDASADGDLAAWAGVPYEMTQDESGLRTMPLTVYMVLGNVDLKKTLNYLRENPEELHIGKIDKWEKMYDEGKPVTLSGFRKIITEAFSNGDYTPPEGGKYDVPSPTFIFLNSTLPHGYTRLLVDMIYSVDITDAQELTRAEISTRMKQVPSILNFIKKYIPGFDKCFLICTPDLIGTRESRRIKGEYTLTEDDVLNNRRSKSVVARCGRAMNVHSLTGGKKGEQYGGTTWIEPSDPKGFDIPYEALVPQGVKNLLVSGRCISANQLALGSIRGEPICMATGEAAGTAAALCVKKKLDNRSLDIDLLQKQLLKQGVELGMK